MYLETFPSRESKAHLQYRSWRWPVLPLGALGIVGTWPRLCHADYADSETSEVMEGPYYFISLRVRTAAAGAKFISRKDRDHGYSETGVQSSSRQMDSPSLGMSTQQYSLRCCCWNCGVIWGLAPHHVASKPVSPTLFDSVSYPNKSCFSKYLFCFSWLQLIYACLWRLGQGWGKRVTREAVF